MKNRGLDLIIFSCAYGLSVFPLCKNVCLDILPIFQLGFLVFVVVELYELFVYFEN